MMVFGVKMTSNILKVWKDDVGRRWYLTDTDDYPYISVSSVIAVTKDHRYNRYLNDIRSCTTPEAMLKEVEKKFTFLSKAGDKGTAYHQFFEDYNKNLIKGITTVSPKDLLKYKQVLDNYLVEVKKIEIREGKVEIVAVEVPVCNTNY